MTIIFSAAEKLCLTPEAVWGWYCLVQQFSAIKKRMSCLGYGCQRLGNQYLDILVIWNAYRKTMLRIPPKKQKKTYRKIVDKRIFAFSHGIVDRKCWLYCCLVSSITKKYNALKRNTTSLWDISVVNQQYNQALFRWPFVDRHRQRSRRTHCSSSWERTAWEMSLLLILQIIARTTVQNRICVSSPAFTHGRSVVRSAFSWRIFSRPIVRWERTWSICRLCTRSVHITRRRYVP